MGRLVLLGLLVGACGGAEPGATAGAGRGEAPRLLVVGWDGATFELLDPLLAAGRLPNLAGLIERGAQASCRSTIVPISSAAWVGAVTGTTPGHHGVYDFFGPLPDSYGVELVSARSNQAPPLWRILGWHGLSSVVFGVPLTWPPEAIDGVMVAGMLAPFDAAYAHPSEYTDQLRARGFEPDLGIWRESGQLTPERMTRQLQLKRAALLELLAGEDWDFTMVVFKSLDVLSHRMYDGRVDTAVAQWCEQLDAVLGDLLAAVGADTNVIVLSDHGFHPYPSTFFPHAWLLEEGYAVQGSPQAGGPGAGPLATVRAAEHAQRVGSLDLARTRVLAGAAEGNFGGLRLNLAGREPEGVVAAGDVDALLDELEARLRAARVQGTDTPLVVDVMRAEELYPGPFTRALLPDLLFETHRDVAVRPVPNPTSFARLNGTFPDHARAGIWVAAGPSIAASKGRGEVDVEDLAPTALNLLGLPAYEEMVARSRTEQFSAGVAVPAPISGVKHAAGRRGQFAVEAGASGQDVLERLQDLGYMDGLEEGD